MKTAVVYYSLEGNTDYAARLIAEELGADIIRLEAVKPYPTDNRKFFVGGKDASLKIKPALREYSFGGDYDLVIIGTPLWAWTMAPPVRTFLSENDLSGVKTAYFVTSGGGKDDKCFVRLKEMTGAADAPCLSLISPLSARSDEKDRSIRGFAASLK